MQNKAISGTMKGYIKMNQVKTSQVIAALLSGKSSTFAQIEYVTEIKPAAAHKSVKIQKLTTANVQLFSDIKAATDVFLNAVKRTAQKISGNNLDNLETFEKSNTYFEHTDCYSIVKHKESEKLYLWAIFNNAISHFLVNGKPATREQVAEFLTPSAKKALLNNDKIVLNAKNDIMHTVQVRTISLENVKAINAAKAKIKFD